MKSDDLIELKKAQAALQDAIGLLMELSRKDFDTETMNKCMSVKRYVFDAKDCLKAIQTRNNSN